MSSRKYLLGVDTQLDISEVGLNTVICGEVLVGEGVFHKYSSQRSVTSSNGSGPQSQNGAGAGAFDTDNKKHSLGSLTVTAQIVLTYTDLCKISNFHLLLHLK